MSVVRSFVDYKLVSAVAIAKHASRSLKNGGSMTFTSGTNKDRPPVPGGAVVAAVAGSFGYFARTLVAPTRVNVVSPGWVDTPMWDALAGQTKAGIQESMAVRLPAGRIGTPADAARAYIYRMESEFTTGETIHVDGGHALI